MQAHTGQAKQQRGGFRQLSFCTPCTLTGGQARAATSISDIAAVLQMELETRVELYEAQVSKLQTQVVQADDDKAALESSLHALRPGPDGNLPDVVCPFAAQPGCCADSCYTGAA